MWPLAAAMSNDERARAPREAPVETQSPSPVLAALPAPAPAPKTDTDHEHARDVAAESGVAKDRALPPPTAYSRIRRRRTDMAPAGPSLDDLMAWLELHNATVDDPDELAELHATICELNGWALPQTMFRAPVLAPPPLPITPPIPANDDVALPPVDPEPMALRAPVTDDDARIILHEKPSEPAGRYRKFTALKAAEAAERFVEWLRIAGYTGVLTSEQIADLYAEHCAAEDLHPIKQATLRNAMAHVSGIAKGHTEKTVKGSGRSKTRLRTTTWIVEPADASVAIPFDIPAAA